MWRRRRPEDGPERRSGRAGRFGRGSGRRLPLLLRILIWLISAVLVFYLIVFVTAWI